MSAIFGLCDGHAIHLLTDGTSIVPATGAVAKIHKKQATTRNRVVVAGIGFWSVPGPRFAQLIDERSADFDEAVARARELWAEARAPVSGDALSFPFTTLLGGWSAARKRLELHLIVTPTIDGIHTTADPTAFEVAGPIGAYGGGPDQGPDARGREAMATFMARFDGKLGSFDAQGDGIAFMEMMRVHGLKMYGGAWRSCVGGHILLTTLTRDSITSEVIHEWPDVVGKPIQLAEEASAASIEGR